MGNNRYLLYGSVRYALGILRPLQDAARARGDEVAWFFDGREDEGPNELTADERRLVTVEQVRQWNPTAVFTSSNALPHFFPGVKVQTFHGFDAGKPRHIYIRPFFDLYCTTGPQDTRAFEALARRHGFFRVIETGWPKLDPFMTQLPDTLPPVRQPPVILYHSTFSPSWSAARTLHDEVRRLSRDGRWRWIVTLHPKTDPEVVAMYRALENEHLRFADAIHPYRDGRSSERTLEAVDRFIAEGGVASLKRRPLDPWRKFKLRRRLRYWGPA